MEYIVIAPHPPKIDGPRAFRGRAQLSNRDIGILADARRHGVIVSYEKGQAIFYCGSRILPRLAVERLIRLGHLVPSPFDPGLIEGYPQRLAVNITR